MPAASEGTPPPGTSSTPRGDAIATLARSLVGSPYRSGGADPSGFDCSGFVQYVFAEGGVALPRSVREQFAQGQSVDEELHAGDLVFFAIDGRDVSHVGVVLDTSSFVHAPSSRGRVRVESLASEYWRRRFAGARRFGE